MGGLSIINNTEIRCINCFQIYKIKIIPEYPKSKILRTCKCSQTSIELSNFFTEYKKNKKFNILCGKCKKSNPKDPFYCEDCKKLYCSNCLKSTHQTEEFKKHKRITIDKYDFFCINHQNDNYCAYCKTCQSNICVKCIKEKLHENHKISIFKKIYDEKKMKEYLRKATKIAEDKINYNKIICNMICKKINKNDVKKLKMLNDINENENKSILEILNIFNEMYNTIKNKNYALISNMIDNMDFNLEKIKFDKNSTKNKDILELVNYFQTDFILKIKVKKEENKNIEGQNNKEKDKNEKESNEINKEEDKKLEEKKEEKKEEEDDDHVKSVKEIQEILENKINEQGGFRSSRQNTVPSSQRYDIINEPKGNPENVINFIKNQKINKKVKKKPRKINFES